MVATLASNTAGLVNGIFGEGTDLHVARWKSIKVTNRFEETDENEVTTIRQRERFTPSLTPVYAGRNYIDPRLRGAASHEERTSSAWQFAVYQGAT